MRSRLLSLTDLLTHTCKQYPDNIAYSHLGTSLSYQQLAQHTQAVAAFLQNTLQLQKGERIAIMLPNILQYPVMMFGAFRAGLTIVNVNPMYTAPELLAQLQETGATSIVVLAQFAHTVEAILQESPLRHVVVTEIGDLFEPLKGWLVNSLLRYVKKNIPTFSLPNAIAFKTVLKQGLHQTLKNISVTGDDIAYLQATGGTTGTPKSVMLTHANMLANTEQMAELAGSEFDSTQTMLTPLPLYHIFSLCVNCLLVMKVGAHNVLIADPRNLKSIITEFKRQPIRAMTGVNTLFNALANHPQFKKLDFSKLKTVIAGGMPLQESVARKWYAITGNYICEGYGLTEASPVVAANPLPMRDFSKGIGKPLPHTALSIRDENNQPLGIDEIGELCVRGPQVMQGYWHRPEETASTFTPDDWLKTGDLARVDAEGYYYIMGRSKNLILVSGFKVYPNQVEDVIARMPGVLEVAVIGIANESGLEAVKACIVKKDLALTEQNVLDFCHQHLTHYKCPKIIEFRESLPKSNVGKVLHRLL